MGAPRGKRNAAREKVWPGATAPKLRELKRQYAQFSDPDTGETNWEAAHKEADKFLRLHGPWMPALDRESTVDNHIAVNAGGQSVPSGESAKLRATAIVYRAPEKEVAGFVCDRCGLPRSHRGGTPGIGKHYCSACQRINAQERRNEWMEGCRFWLDIFDSSIKTLSEPQPNSAKRNLAYSLEQKAARGDIHSYMRIEPDFSPALINDIEEAEIAFDMPIANWPRETSRSDLFANPNNQKMLAFSHDAVLRMSNDTAIPDVRRVRPRWKIIRGEWA